jgi:hypothetical protein
MTKERKVPVTPAIAYPLGHAKENKDASAYTEFKYPSGGGNDIGVYKQPMTNPNGTEHEAVAMSGNGISKMNISVGGVSKGNYGEVNPYGVKEMRGYGAATKGRKISGKQG